MKDNKKKILAAAAFLIAAGLLFGMTKKENGSRELDDSGAVVMSGSQKEFMGSKEKRGSEKNVGLLPDPSGSDGEKIRRLKVRAASGNPGKPEMKPGRGKVLQKRRWKWITRRQQGSMCISAERL